MKLERILYVSHRYHTNQVPVMKGWKEKGVDVMFLAQYEGVSESHDCVRFYKMRPSLLTRLYNRWADMVYNPSKAESKKNKAFVPSCGELKRIIREFAPQIVIIRNLSIGNARVCRVCNKLGIKFLINYTQTPLYGNPSSVKAFSGLASKVFPKVSFTPVLYRGEERNRRDISDKWYYPHYFIPLVSDTYERESGYCKDGTIHLLDVGKYRGYKNHFFLIDALADVADKSRFSLTVIGQLENSAERDYYRKLSEYVKSKGLEDVVSLRGNVPFGEMDKVYASADVLVLPSRSETAGMVILEAMARGLCVLSSDNCGLACYLEENSCGMVFSLKDTTVLTSQLESLDRGLISGLGAKSVEVVRKNYSFDRYFEGLAHLMKDFYKEGISI